MTKTDKERSEARAVALLVLLHGALPLAWHGFLPGDDLCPADEMRRLMGELLPVADTIVRLAEGEDVLPTEHAAAPAPAPAAPSWEELMLDKVSGSLSTLLPSLPPDATAKVRELLLEISDGQIPF